MGVVLRKNTGGSSNAQGSSYRGSFTDYSDLSTELPTSNVGDFAVVENSQGTSWLPWTLGGTYYPQGTYYWDGSKWDTNVEKIAEQLNTNVDNISQLQIDLAAETVSRINADNTLLSQININTDNISDNNLVNRIIVNQSNVAVTLGGVIDSTKAYFLDGVIDLGSIEIEVPDTGINIKGYDFNTSGLFSSEDNYTMFTSPVGGSGDVVWDKLNISVTGINSKVFDIEDSTGFNAIEITNVNYNNCTSLGTINGYRQGLETGTGRFGGSPSLELEGTWLGGFIIDTSIVRNMSNVTTEPLFKAGGSFVMNSRFKTDLNVDLGSLQPLTDFSTSNFAEPSTFQIQGAEITRGGVYAPNDININPNILSSDLECYWTDNNGINNTYVGGVQYLTSETVTPINSVGVYVPVLGTFTPSDLQHFDSPANGQLRNLGTSPREFKIIAYIILDGGANDVISIRLRKYNSSLAANSTIVSQLSTVNNFQGGNDRCTFSILGRTTLDVGDYYFIEVANTTDTTNVTVKIGTFTTIEKRT